MEVVYEDRSIVLRTDNVLMGEMEKAYMRQFDGAIAKFVCSTYGDKLVISIGE